MFEKPFGDIGRARFEGRGKRAFGGKSVRRLQPFEASRRFDSLSEVESGASWKGAEERQQSRFLSRIEYSDDSVEDLEWSRVRDAPSTLNRAGAWETLPAALEAYAVAQPAVSRQQDGTRRLTYKLEAVVEQLVNKKNESLTRRQKLAEERRRRHATSQAGSIFTLDGSKGRRRPTLFAVPPTEPPDEVSGAALVPRAINGRTGAYARVRANHPRDAFCVERAGGVGGRKAHLDVDLGRDCVVSHVSSQGRHPPTRTYPQVERRRHRAAGRGDKERYTVEAHPDWSLARDGQYEGPFYQVVSLGDERYHKEPRQRWQEELQWVTRYEVWARQEGERGWRAVGTFRGNTDATTEVAHSLRSLDVRARYLRFRPVEAVGGGAMRVGVYGHATDASGRGGARRRKAGAAVVRDDGPPLISYTIGEAGCAATLGHVVKSGSNGGRCRCSICRRTSDQIGSSARQARRSALQRTLASFAPCGRDAVAVSVASVGGGAAGELCESCE